MHLLFVCTGNTCRSPLAEGIARHAIAERGLVNLTVGSAGVSAWDGAPASDGSLLVAMEHGIDLSAHRARQLTDLMVAESQLILALGTSHLQRVQELGGGDRAYLLTDWATGGREAGGVSDPFGGDLAVYRQTYVEIAELVHAVLDRLAAENGPRAD